MPRYICACSCSPDIAIKVDIVDCADNYCHPFTYGTCFRCGNSKRGVLQKRLYPNENSPFLHNIEFLSKKDRRSNCFLDSIKRLLTPELINLHINCPECEIPSIWYNKKTNLLYCSLCSNQPVLICKEEKK